MPSSLVLTLFFAAAAWARPSATAGIDDCPLPARDAVLLQTKQELVHSRSSQGAIAVRSHPLTSDCAPRLDSRDRRNAACLIIRDSQALLVNVERGSQPAWDLPGGWRQEDEYACETAEREACKETGMQVKAVRQLTFNVFQCEVVGESRCQPPEEGFLEQRWVDREEADGLHLRPGTWGDKAGLLRSVLRIEHAGRSLPDVCGCDIYGNEGFSSAWGRCIWGRDTDPGEACACWRRDSPGASDALRDLCGCLSCEGQGWSSRSGTCTQGSSTTPEEAQSCVAGATGTTAV